MTRIEELKAAIKDAKASLATNHAKVRDLELALEIESNPWLKDGLFTRDELAILPDGDVISPKGEAPWLGPFGACLVRVYEVRRAEDGTVEFGVGNEKPPVLGWVHKGSFYEEWPQ